MRRFAQFTNLNGNPILIDVSRAVAIIENPYEKKTESVLYMIMLDSSARYAVRESLVEIEATIDGAYGDA